nr:MAG TPA: hypothetical protein [Caudoviricetes sp.]
MGADKAEISEWMLGGFNDSPEPGCHPNVQCSISSLAVDYRWKVQRSCPSNSLRVARNTLRG